jgi:hypothetical protein
MSFIHVNAGEPFAQAVCLEMKLIVAQPKQVQDGRVPVGTLTRSSTAAMPSSSVAP